MRRLFIALVTVLTSSLAQANSVGVATMVIGAPTAVSAGNAESVVLKGAEIEVGSTIRTGSGDHVHLRFNDGTLVSVRPLSELAVVEYEVADSEVLRFRLELSKGVMRTISGDGLKRSREKFRLNTPIAAIGIRGTDFTTTTRDAETRVQVHSGEVVMTPFGEQCLVAALGPCSSEGSMSLVGGTQDILRLRAGSKLPEVVSPDMAGTLESESVAPSPVSDTRVSVNQDESDRSVVNRVNSDQQVEPFNDVEPFPFIDTDDDLVEQNGALVWGHWFNVPDGDTWSKPATSLIGRFDPTVSNAVYGLFRDPIHAGLVAPVRPQVSLKLSAADATYTQDAFATKARVSEGVLFLDFTNNSFVSKLTVDTDRAGSVGLEGVGVVSPTGIFVSKSSSDRMAGAVTPDGLEAGMLFEKKVGSGVVQGISLWNH